jgi:DNA-binding transcriptional LysR family regulator
MPARAQKAPQRTRERQQSSQGVVHLGLVPSAMHSVLPGLLRRIANAGRNLRVEALGMTTSQQLRALRGAELDVCHRPLILCCAIPGQAGLQATAGVARQEPAGRAGSSWVPGGG